MALLPFDILHLICGMALEPDQKSFSLVSRKTFQVAIPFLYRRLTLHISYSRPLQETVTDLLEHPTQRQYLEYMRELTIEGKMYTPDQFSRILHGTDRTSGETPQRARHFAERHLPGCAEYWSPASLDPSYKSLFKPEAEKMEEDAALWLPLAVLVAKLRYLTEFDYGCQDPIAPCVLAALRHYHPSCGLSLTNFDCYTLRRKLIIPYEFGLMQYPTLHTLKVNEESERRLNEEAVMDAIKFMS